MTRVVIFPASKISMNQINKRTRREIISLKIDAIKYQDALTKIIEQANSRTPAYVCFANVHMVVEGYKSEAFARQVNDAMLVLPDGMPVVNAVRKLYRHSQERVAGMDVMPDLIRLSQINKLRVFFFGTSDDMLDKIRVKTERDFPEVEIAGLFSPPFKKSLDDESYIHMINESGANLVFVALGCPKQEKWMASHSSKIKAVLLGVGGAFPIYAETAKRAPEWIRNLSLEWVFRLGQEPTRLFKRYLKTNSLFIYLIFKHRLKNILERTPRT